MRAAMLPQTAAQPTAAAALDARAHSSLPGSPESMIRLSAAVEGM